MPRIDPHQVVTMATYGVPRRLIARRLGCTERHVRRILAEARIEGREDPAVGTDAEPAVWRLWLGLGDSFRAVGYRYGVSHETVRQRTAALAGPIVIFS